MAELLRADLKVEALDQALDLLRNSRRQHLREVDARPVRQLDSVHLNKQSVIPSVSQSVRKSGSQSEQCMRNG